MSRYDDEYDDRDRDRNDDRDRDRDRDDDFGDRTDRIIDRAKQQVKTPAIVLLVVGILSLLSSLSSIVNVFTLEKQFTQVEEQWDKDPNMTPQQKKEMKQMLADLKGPIKILIPISIVVGSLVALLTIVGSVKMMNLTGRGMAIAGSILSMLPFSGCCCLGLPVGIWVLIVLSRPEVKAGFAAMARSRGGY